MKKKTIEASPLSMPWDGSVIGFGNLEEFARQRIQGWLQGLLEEEVTRYLGLGMSGLLLRMALVVGLKRSGKAAQAIEMDTERLGN